MAVSQEQKVDFLLKKIGFTASKTGSVSGTGAVSGTAKAGFAEAIPSPLVIASTSVWADSSFIPATPPGSDSAYVKVYLSGTSGLRMTYDNTVSNQRSFVARSTYGNQTSAILGDWIDTQFGADYIIKVYKGDPNSGGVQLSAAGSGSNDGWFFDYSSGILNFNDTNVPSGVTDTNIYIVGYRYIGTKGLQPPAGIGTFSTLDVTGIATFRNDVNFLGANYNIQFDQSADALDFTDNAKARFGSSDDLSIYHSSATNNSIIANTTGILQILGDDVRIKNAANNADLARFVGGGAASLYHNNTARIYTTSTGAEVAGNLNVTGVLTYDDVTNIDSLGIVTARTGVHILANGINVQAGVATFAAAIDANANVDIAGNLDVDGLTNLDDVNVSAAATFAGNIDANGDIDVDGHTELDNVNISGVTTFVGNIDANGNLDVDGQTDLDVLNVAELATFAGNIDANGDLDVDGETELDNLNVAGVSTYAGALDINSDIDVDGHTELDNVNISGLTTAALLNVTNLTAGRVTYAGASGRLVDSANLSFDGTDLTAASAKITDLTSGRVVLAGTSGALEDSNNLRFTGSSLIVTGSQTVSVDLNVAGISTVTGLLDANGGLTANTAKVEDLTSGRVVLAGTGGEIEDSGNLTFNGSTLAVTGSQTVSGNLDIVGNVSIGGTLTYEDVTNIDSVGIVTARTGIKVLSGGINAVGVVTSTNAIDANGGIDVAGVSTIANLKVGSVTVTHIRDEDNMASNSDTSLATQQSIKAYVDSQVTAQDLDVAGDSGTGSVDLDSQSLTIAGTSNEIETSASGQTITIGLPNDVTIGAALTVTGASTFTGNIDANGNLDVDGQTDLDHVNISGVTTATGNIIANGNIDLAGDIDVDGHTNLDNVSIAGITTFSDDVNIIDSKKIQLGNDADLKLYHNGTSSYIDNNTSHVYIRNNVDNDDGGNIYIQAKSGENSIVCNDDGNIQLYYDNVNTFQTNANGIKVQGPTGGSAILYLNADQGSDDTDKFRFKVEDGGPFKIENDASGSWENSIQITGNGAVSLYYDNTLRFQTSGIGATVTGQLDTTDIKATGITTTVNLNVSGSATIASIGSTVGITSSVYFGDNDRIWMGDGDDLFIYHDSADNNSYITEQGSGSLIIRGADVEIQTAGGNKYFTGAANVAKIYHTNNEKLGTKVWGVEVTGTTDTDGLVVSGVSTLTGNVVTSADVSFSGSSYNATWITAGDKLRFNDNASATFGTQDDLQIYHNNTSAYIRNTSGNLRIQPKSGEQGIILKPDGAIETYYDNSKKISTSGIGVTVYNQLDVTNINATGVITATSFTGTITNPSADITTRNLSVTGLSTFTGAIDANGDLDVDGHAEFDNIRVAGVSTFAGQLNAGAIAAASASFTGDVSVGGTLTYQDVTNIDSVGIVTARTDLHVGTGSTTIKTLNGKVGINSTVPVHMLDVGGVINSSTDIRINNVSLAGGASVDDATALAIALG